MARSHILRAIARPVALVPALAIALGFSAAAQPTASIGALTPPPEPNLSALSLNQATVAVSRVANDCVVGVSVPPGKINSKRWEYWDEYLRQHGRAQRNERYKDRRVSSGIVVSSDGYVLTNHHVIDDAPEDSILVLMPGGETYRAELVGSDPLTDVAVLRIYGRGFPVAYIGESDSVQVGEWVLAVGNPAGLRSTTTAGIVSAVGRQTDKTAEDDDRAIESYIQFDAAVNPGNSGGGLFDLRGRLVGVVSALYSFTGFFTGYGLAVPSTLAKVVAQDIIEDGVVDRAWLGVAASDVVDTSARSLRLEKISGAVIDDIEKGSPAERGGLRERDVILGVDGKPVRKLVDLQSFLAARSPGSRLEVDVWRAGRMEKATVELGRQKGRDSVAARKPRPASIGVMAEDINEALARRESLTVSRGVVVSRVDPYTNAARAGVLRGDVLVSIDNMELATVNGLQAELRQRRPGDEVRLVIRRGDETIEKKLVVEHGPEQTAR